MECACSIKSSVAYSALLYFSILYHKRHHFRKKVTNIKCMVCFLHNLCAKYFSFLKRTERDMIKKCILVFMQNTRNSCQIVLKREFFSTDFPKILNYHFHENPSSGSRVVACGWTDMITLIVAFRNFANAPKNHVIHMYYSNITRSNFIYIYK